MRDRLWKKLGRPPYRYTSRQLWESKEVLEITPRVSWRFVEEHLEAMMVEGLVHGQNGYFVRKDRLFAMPPERAKKPKKKDPRQGDLF